MSLTDQIPEAAAPLAPPLPAIEPTDDRLVIRQSDPETVTAGGLLIPANAQEKPQEGVVLAVGPGRWIESNGTYFPLPVAVGATVIYSKYGGSEIRLGREDVLIIAWRDVLAILPEA